MRWRRCLRTSPSSQPAYGVQNSSSGRIKFLLGYGLGLKSVSVMPMLDAVRHLRLCSGFKRSQDIDAMDTNRCVTAFFRRVFACTDCHHQEGCRDPQHGQGAIRDGKRLENNMLTQMLPFLRRLMVSNRPSSANLVWAANRAGRRVNRPGWRSQFVLPDMMTNTDALYVWGTEYRRCQPRP